MVTALANQGIDLRAVSEVVAISAVTGIVEPIVAYKASRFIPAVAARDRRPTLNGLRLFNEQHPASHYFRYIVVTRGEVIPVGGDLRVAVKKFHRRLSKWAAWSREQGVEVLVRATEFTRKTAAQRKMTDKYTPDTALFHLHCNLETWPKFLMTEAKWKEYLAGCRRFFKAHWQDNGRIEDESEIVKYCCKPTDLENSSDAELAWIYHQTRRLKFVQPLGEFADFMAALKQNGEKVAYVRPGGGDHPRLMAIKKAQRLDHSKRRHLDPAQSEPVGRNSPPTNIVLGMTLPQWRHSPFAEPMILVLRYDPTAKGKGDLDRLRELELDREVARAHWDAAGAPAPKEALRIAKKFTSGKKSSARSGRSARRRRAVL